MNVYTEDTLVQRTTVEYLRDALGWDSVYAFNEETYGPDGTLGREDQQEVVLIRYLRQKLEEFNKGLPEDAYQDAVKQITEYSYSQSLLATNRDKYAMLKDGVQVRYRDAEGKLKKERLRVFDFDNPEENHFLCVREMWIKGDLYRRRPDIIGSVNGIPLLFIECKNVHRDLQRAYSENFSDYKDTIPQIFIHNALVMLGNGIESKIGSVSSKYGHFGEWKRLTEDEPGGVDMETMLKGICDKRNFMDLFENFIVFDDSSGKLVKILARNHQYLGVNRAYEAVLNRKLLNGKLGVFWHTQGAGKSYSMVFFTQKIHRKLGGNYTFLICTDRVDLDNQIYKTFAGCGLVDNDRDPCRARDSENLQALLGQQKTHIFTLIQKFHQDVDPGDGYTNRDDLIVISDEAHRSQYGRLALNMRNALTEASFIGFTGTPLFKDDQITKRIFGDYVSTYDFQRAVEDGATVPLYYDARGDKLKVSTDELNERVAAKLEEIEIEDLDVQQRLEQELKRDYHIITADKRLKKIARDFVKHYSTAWESGKAMIVCIDKVTCVKMYNLIEKYWQERLTKLERGIRNSQDDQEEIYRNHQIAWMKETQKAVVISEEQGEVDKFRKWGLDILPHRKLMKKGMDIPENLRSRPEFSGIQSLDVDSAFKEEEHPFRIVIVCAMWLTGFDVPSLSNLYLDKPLKAHTLMQAIARANRVNEGKNNGLVIDYCGILKNLRKALADFAGTNDGGRGGEGGTGGKDPTDPESNLLEELEEAISMARAFLADRDASLDDIIEKTGFERNEAISAAKEAANENNETRKRFEIICREVFRKFKACLNMPEVNNFKKDHDALSIVYKCLQDDREKADISDIIRQLHQVVDESIDTQGSDIEDDQKIYDISQIDFDRLRKEFERCSIKKTTVQNLMYAVEQRLCRMLEQNPLRADFQKHYEELVREYNQEKDRVTIEQTFEELMKFIIDLDDEEDRAMREGLDEESLAIYDLIRKSDLTKRELKRLKQVSTELLAKLKAEKLKIDHWRDKEATRDSVFVTIKDFLWEEETGLPLDSYSEDEIGTVTSDVYRHVFRVYPTLPSPFYAQDVA